MIPRAPASRAYLICQLVLPETPVAGIRIIGVTPALSIALTLSAAPGTNGTVPCSQSTTIHDRWGLDLARVRACKSPGTVNHAPKAGWDDRKAFRREWVVMDNRNSSTTEFAFFSEILFPIHDPCDWYSDFNKGARFPPAVRWIRMEVNHTNARTWLFRRFLCTFHRVLVSTPEPEMRWNHRLS